MLETCENCGGKGKTHEIPPKRCHECNGKGVVEVDTFGVIDFIETVDLSTDKITVVQENEDQTWLDRRKSHWYTRLRDWYVGLFN